MRTVRKKSNFSTKRFAFVPLLLTAFGFLSGSTPVVNYEYPYRDPYIATATTAILSDNGAAAKSKSEVVHVPGLPGRNKLPPLEGRGDLAIALYRQSRPAPLIFILGGIGSNPFFGVGPYLASLFHREGTHVVILPSPMTWNFALSASRSGAPGFVPADASDLYEVLQKTLATLRQRYRLDMRGIHFMGVSLGALQGAHLSVIDEAEGKIGIAKYLLVNPPVDLVYAAEKLHEWNAWRQKFGREKSRAIVAKAVAIVDSFAGERNDDPAVIERLTQRFAGFTTAEFQLLFAENLQSHLPELLYVTQLLHDQEILRAPRDQMRRRLEEAMNFAMTDYFERVALPVWRRNANQPQAPLATFMNRGSLTAILDRLRRNSRVHISHNADDFFAERQSREAIKAALGDQMTLYPYGGHLGNLWYRENQRLLLKLVR